jgi:hypothetical protein
MSGRQRARGRLVQRTGLIAAALVVLTLLFVITGNWILAIVAGVPAAAAVWVFLQARSVR